MNIYQKLIEVRKEVQYLKKENQGHQYNYVSSSQVLASLKKKMDSLNLLLIPEVTGTNVREDMVESQDKFSNPKHTTTYFTELTMKYTWVNADDPAETIVCTWYGQGVDIAGEKGVGKAMTYAEKYFMLKFFNIPTDKDDPDAFQGKHDDEPKPEPKQQPKKATQQDALKPLELKCSDCGATINTAVKTFSEKKFNKPLCMDCQKKVSKGA